ncbi:hypothetical protein JJB99_11065 [Bradyrhizobium diazoefficiens]|uniref:hypothetical protein n=1 Tax=Bradyrhizobium diazoefficiens TaxID=1355477 RepID=UPI00190A9DB3|nr:hypothetical protein [Bradyrhizobium diazoefficiens]QQO16648.1 hypothetical protein JJB99_11065 [Bradyrhizobium diazoefficiens]
MKSRILDSEDASVLVFGGAAENLKNDARSRMWFKRQFLALGMRISSQRIRMKQQCFARDERARPLFAISLECSREGLRFGLASEALASRVIPGRDKVANPE